MDRLVPPVARDASCRPPVSPNSGGSRGATVAAPADSSDYLPVQIGVRFSRNAANPSCASSVPELAAMTPPAWS